MSAARALEQTLSGMNALRGLPGSVVAAELSKFLASKSNVVAAKAADLAREGGHKSVEPQLADAFARFMKNPHETDRGCAAKQAIVNALYELGCDAEAVFLAGIRHVQKEGAYGKPVDTAVETRGLSALGLVRMAYRDVMPLLVDLLADDERKCFCSRINAQPSLMKHHAPLLLAICLALPSCAPTAPPPNAQIAAPATTQPTSALEPNALQSLHVRLAVDPADGTVQYLGWYDGRRNLLGPNGITAAIVGIEPPEMKGQLARAHDAELVFTGTDQMQVKWVKRYRLDGNTVHAAYRVTNLRDQPFDAIVYSLADLPDATITGDNRDQFIRTPTIKAHFHATIDNPHFPGEQMNPYAMRSDSHRLEPGDSMEFKMTWELEPALGGR